MKNAASLGMRSVWKRGMKGGSKGVDVETAHLMLNQENNKTKQNTFQRVSSSMERPRQRPQQKKKIKIKIIKENKIILMYMTKQKSHLTLYN